MAKNGRANSENLRKLIFALFLILLVALFFRAARFSSFFYLDHDHDLMLWIVKDIFVDHHLRLIGNLTRIEGIFIGPLYYYLTIPFVALSRMDPRSIAIPALLIGIATTLSIYYVFSRFFGKFTGLIGAFLYATSMQIAFFDRVPYPSQPVYLWSTWFLYTLLSLLQGEKKALLVGAILIGLIWHIHIVLLPLVPVMLLAIWLSGKKPKVKNLIIPFFAAAILTLPLWLFELRHGFLQIKSIIALFSFGRGEENITTRIVQTLEAGSTAFVKPFTYNLKIPPFIGYLFAILVSVILIKAQALKHKQAVLIWSWIMLGILSQVLSQKKVNDYYFDNVVILALLLVSILLSRTKTLTCIVLAVFFIYNFMVFTGKATFQNNYVQKKAIVETIKNHSLGKKFPCIGVSYIGTPGVGTGFRYLFWLNNIHVINSGYNVPTYDITIPVRSGEGELTFGGMGLVLPEETSFTGEQVCRDPNNQLAPLLGFTG